jgi:hypothetical protein
MIAVKHIPSVVVIAAFALSSCANEDLDPSKPAAVVEHKSLMERLSESGGYKQDEEGNWVPKSDRRSAYDSQRDSPYFKGKIEKENYKTGDYAKKSWWGKKNYEAGEYSGNTDGSRFQTKARQNGQLARANGDRARMEGPFETNTLNREGARESGYGGIDRPGNAYSEAQRKTYKAPSVIDWRAQRQMSVEQSKGILGR